MYIDWVYQSYVNRSVGSRLDIGPFSRIGATFDVVFCGAVGVITLWTGITGQVPGYAVAIVAGVLEIVFVRVCIRSFRGDFDEFVLDSPELEGDDPDGTS